MTSRPLHRFLVLVAAALACLPAWGATPSFVCKQARSWVEKTVCRSDALATLDLELASVRSRLLSSLHQGARPALEGEQNRWWAGLRACRSAADPVACLRGRYEHRIAAIRAHPDYPGDTPRPPPDPEPSSIATAGKGWTRDLSKYQRALRACNEESATPIGKVLVAWPGDDADTVMLRVVDWNLREWVCAAHRSGHKVFRFAAPAPDEKLPPAGPVYHVGGSAPPPRCMNATQVLDVGGRPAGWISDEDC